MSRLHLYITFLITVILPTFLLTLILAFYLPEVKLVETEAQTHQLLIKMGVSCLLLLSMLWGLLYRRFNHRFYLPLLLLRETVRDIAQEKKPKDLDLSTASDQSIQEIQISLQHIAATHGATQQKLAELEITSTTLVAKSITEQKQNQTELHHLWAAIEFTSDIMLLTDASGRILYLNPSFQKVTFFSRDEIIGFPPYRLIQRKSRLHSFRQIRKCLSKKNIWQGILHCYCKNKRLIILSCSITPIFGPDGSTVRYVITGSDVTSAKKRESQVQQAHKLEALGTLSAGIAHDFNNILGSIIGYTELAMDDIPQSGLTHSNLEQVLVASFRARDLVAQILTFSRQSGTEKIPLHIQSLIKETVKLIQSSIPGVRIKLNLEHDTDMILADPISIHQLIANLCTNAAQAMKQQGNLKISLGNISIDQNFVQKYPALKPGNHIKLSISDKGAGIPGEIIDKIFDPFFSTREVGENVGLGLSVVHGIVQKHDGLTVVKSTHQQGSCFEIYFPSLRLSKESLTEYLFSKIKQ